jgi:hypothetical protein
MFAQRESAGIVHVRRLSDRGNSPPDPSHRMPECPFCGAHLVRRHRKAVEKLVYLDCFYCKQCGLKTFRWRPELRIDRWFIASSHARCPRCSRSEVRRGTRHDRIESTSKHLLSRMQRWLFAPLTKCAACRLQFYDVRPIKSSAVEEASPSPEL